MNIRELKSTAPWTLVRRVAEGIIFTAMFAGIVAITGILIYQFATSTR